MEKKQKKEKQPKEKKVTVVKKPRGGDRPGAGREKMDDKYKTKFVLVPGPVIPDLTKLISNFWLEMREKDGIIDHQHIYSQSFIEKKLRTTLVEKKQYYANKLDKSSDVEQRTGTE